VKFRLYFARIGSGLHLASKPFILEDFIAADAERNAPSAGNGPVGHAMVRLRPEYWDQVLADFRFGWAENNREACINNLGPLSSVSRAITSSVQKIDRAAELSRQVCQTADQLHTVHFFCPEGGTYLLAPDGKSMICTVHGSALESRQPVAPSAKSSLGRLLQGFGGMTATLTFLPEGLRAVVEIERK
jgi:hypothetical protein